VYEAPNARLGTGPQGVVGAVDVRALELLAIAPVADHRGRMERQLALRRALAHGRDVRELAVHRLSPSGPHALRRGGRAHERAHRVAVED